MYENIKEMKVDLVISGGISEEKIIYFSKELEIEFGIEYTSFLKEFGTLSIEYLEFLGICGENNSIPSSIYSTKKARKEIKNFRNDLIVIYEIGDGTFYAIDKEDRVFFCDYNNSELQEKSFKEFILSKIEKL